MKYSLCIEPLYEETPFADRLELVSKYGFKTVEFWDPGEKDLNKLKENSEKLNMQFSICTLNDPWGEKRLNADEEEFIGNFEKSIPMLKKIDCNKVIVLTGEVEENNTEAEQKERIISNLKTASRIAEKEDILIVLEALNSYVDHKGYFLDSSKAGFEIVKKVSHPRVKLLYDVYHMQIMEGNIIENIKNNIDLIGHFHSAGVPGRHELFDGELDYKTIIKEIDKLDYDGYFGIEYFPALDCNQSLKQMKEFLNI